MTTKIKCPVCGEYGILILKTTKTKAKGRMYTYQKWYVYHNKTRKQKWCYLSKALLEREDIKRAIESYTKLHKTATQNENRKNQSFSKEKPRAGFDPATYGLQGRCSTRLSYRGIGYTHTIRYAK